MVISLQFRNYLGDQRQCLFKSDNNPRTRKNNPQIDFEVPSCLNSAILFLSKSTEAKVFLCNHLADFRKESKIGKYTFNRRGTMLCFEWPVAGVDRWAASTRLLPKMQGCLCLRDHWRPLLEYPWISWQISVEAVERLFVAAFAE